MLVYLLRHGVAQESRPGSSDHDRPLTSEGKRKLRDVLHNASQGEVHPSLILSSPLKRAVQTAEIAKTILNYRGEIPQTDALSPGSSVEQVWEEIRSHRHEPELILVGHDPLFSNLPPYLLNAPSLKVEFKKGAMMRIDFDRFSAHPHGTLRWYLVAKLAAYGSNHLSKAAAGGVEQAK